MIQKYCYTKMFVFLGTCTLMELLKEEYERSERAKARKQARERAHPVVSSTHSLSSIQVRRVA